MLCKIALTSYLNTRPLYYHRPIPGCQLLLLPPAMTVSALRKGDIDAGIVPVAGLPLLQRDFELLGPYGIASNGQVKSVALFSKIPFQHFTQGHTVLLCPESMSSNKLLFLLLNARSTPNQAPEVVNSTTADGELVIGDKALLRYYQGNDAYVTDLAEQWKLITGKPFVFARWVIRKDAPTALKYRLLDWLADFKENEATLHLQTVEQEWVNYLPLTAEQLLDYLQRIRCFIADPELQGQTRFINAIKTGFIDQISSAHNANVLLKAS
jgi:chorismate dehydratase